MSSNRSIPAGIVKQEPPRIPSPTPSYVTLDTATTPFKPEGPPSPTPSCSSTVLFGGRDRGTITLRPISAIVDRDDQMSTLGRIAPPPPIISDRKVDLSAFRPSQTTPVTDINDWRCSIKNVGDRLKYIFENDDKYQDVVFLVEGANSTQQFKAHKLILRIASPVFDRMFQQVSQIVIKDMEPDTFNLLLKFIYTDEVDTSLDEQGVLLLLQAASTYQVRPLYLECVRLLKKCMSRHTFPNEFAVKLCDIATSYGDELLLNTALDHIANKAFEIFPSEAFLQLSLETVHKLFCRNDLRIDEETLFEAAIKWGENSCNKQGLAKTQGNLRKVMECLIPEIRFPLLRQDVFTFVVLPTQILTLEEQVGIYQYLSVDTTKRDKLPPISFKTTPRLSQKCLDLDSSSSSDYREGSSTSPEQHQDLPSTPIAECLDLTTTEAESETASNVSVYSDSRKKSRKLERSVSHSSGNSSSKKRRKTIDNEVNYRKCVEKSEKASKRFNIEELLVNDKKCIEWSEATGSLNNLIQQCSRLDRRDKIESIKLENVTIEDAKRLEGRKVSFPRLKKFELKVTIEESISSIISEDTFALEKYLFFETGKHESWSYDKLWKTGIDITVIINKVIVLRVSREQNHVILNKFSGAPSVLKSLKEQPIKSIVYSHTHFTDKGFPRCLHRIVILGVVSSQPMSSFIKQFKHLKELTVVSPAPGSVKLRSVTLDAEFASKDKIRKLGLGNFKLDLEPSIRFYNIVTLSLWGVSWGSYFEEKFHHAFPKLQELCLIGPAKGTPRLLKNIFKINSLTEFVNWNCDFQLSESDGYDQIAFLRECGLGEPEKSFVLKKKSDKSGWQGSKMTYNDFNCNVYKRFEYEYLYEDISTFMTIS